MNAAVRHPSIADTVLLVSPSHFYSNTETRASNHFQIAEDDRYASSKAFKEFEGLYAALSSCSIEVLRFESIENANTPDAVFPNNWFSTHAEGKIFLYPMLAINRRKERRQDIIESLQKTFGPYEQFDLTAYETQNKFLEGTGSLVLDREHRYGFCAVSSRTHEEVLSEFSQLSGIKLESFRTRDANGNEVYHTNVMMSMGLTQVVICLDSVFDQSERQKLQSRLEAIGKNIISISLDQMSRFCGNILLLQNLSGERYWFMSQSAFDSFSTLQKELLKQDGHLVPVSIPTIERLGGGSVRCMMAEIFKNRHEFEKSSSRN